MLNYKVEPALLNRYVPPGTTLDSFEGHTYLSLVGFRFCHTKLLGCFPVPFHVNFEEVNLRFYVRRREGSEIRRGVVFITEIVPRRAIAATARLIYGENYKYHPMKHSIQVEATSRSAEYRWQVGDQWCRISAQTAGPSAQTREGSLEQFITEHYWGYSALGVDRCLEYHVAHIPWQVWSTAKAGFEGNAGALYGEDLAAVIQRSPACSFVADGSAVSVFTGKITQ